MNQESEERLPTSLEEVEAELCQRSLMEFTRLAWQVLEPDTPYKHNWHIEAVTEHLEAVSRGEIKKLIINVPPGHMKSLSVNVFWPAWEWAFAPHLRYLFASYASDLSERDNIKMQLLIQSEWYRRRFGARYSLVKATERKLVNDKLGFRIASSTGGVGTGERVHRVVNDDLLRANDAHSEAMRDRAIGHMRAMSTRGVDPQTFTQVLIMQRLHDKDPAGWALEQGGWEHLRLPAEYEPKSHTLTSIGWSDPRTVAGEPLWPGQFPPDVLAQFKKDLGSYGYAAQCQQRPSPGDGGTLKRDWWKRWTVLPSRFDRMLISADLAFEGTDRSDYCVFQAWGFLGSSAYLIDQVRDRMEFPTQLQAFKDFCAKHPRILEKIVEKKANGAALIASVEKGIPGVVAFEPKTSKLARAMSISPTVEAGNVYIPSSEQCPWVGDFVEECAAFPKGANDDQVDGMTQALIRVLIEPIGEWPDEDEFNVQTVVASGGGRATY